MNTPARIEKLEGALSLHTVSQVLARLAPTLARGDAVTIDLSAVNYADSAGVSLLLELLRRAQAGSAKLQFSGAPEQLRRLTKFFAVDSLLSLT